MAKNNGGKKNTMPGPIRNLRDRLGDELGEQNVKFVGSSRQFGSKAYHISPSRYNPENAIEVYVADGRNTYFRFAVLGPTEVRKVQVETALQKYYL